MGRRRETQTGPQNLIRVHLRHPICGLAAGRSLRVRHHQRERRHERLQRASSAPTMHARKMLCQITALKMSASLPIWFVAGRRHADALGVDHLAHHAAGAVRRADQHLRLLQRQVAHRAGAVAFAHLASAVIFCRLPNRALLPASVPVRNTPSQPSIAAKNGYSTPVSANATPERRVHAGVLGHVAQARACTRSSGSAPSSGTTVLRNTRRTCGRGHPQQQHRRRAPRASTGVPGAVSQANLNTAVSALLRRRRSPPGFARAGSAPLAPRLCSARHRRPRSTAAAPATSNGCDFAGSLGPFSVLPDHAGSDQAHGHDDERRPRQDHAAGGQRRLVRVGFGAVEQRRRPPPAASACGSCGARPASASPASAGLGRELPLVLRLPHELQEQRQRDQREDRRRRCRSAARSAAARIQAWTVAKKYWNTANDPPPTSSAGHTASVCRQRTHAS